MANSPQARKRARQNETRRLHNAAQRSTVRSSIKDVLKKVQSKDLEAARDAYQRATSLIDKAVRRGHHHRNRAARLKSRLNERVRQISVS
ncbi:MAG: 30S ribosomal protein S20 [Gammaproteobacteria bacterium]|nr:30S ribosomal protein S20 [Gammaproteobacteria bacterium]